ncbi:MAG: chaperonin GroEL [Planctomycetota bacterium]
MNPTRLLLRDEARARLLQGTTALADAVRATLGPRSRCILIAQSYGAPLVCNDGVTIAKRVHLEDPVQDLGAQVLRQAAERTGDAVGDGTTTSTLLAHALFSEGLRNVAAGASAIDLKRGIELGAKAACAALAELSRPVASRRERAQVATISAHNDAGIGELVASAMEKVGPEGVVTVEEAKGTETALECVEGLQFDRGYLSPYFVTDPARLEAVLEDPFVLVCERRIANVNELVPVLEQVAQANRPMLVIAEDLETEVIATLVVNRLRGNLVCIAVKAPGFGDRRRAMLEDIAILTGAALVSEDLGAKLSKLQVAELGSAKRIVVDRQNTTIIGGGGDKTKLEARRAELRREIEAADSDYERDKLRERLARLTGGVAILRVGAPTEAEMKNRKEALEDAISATKAAVAEGIVPGGGVALLRTVPAVERLFAECRGDVLTGARILAASLATPARQIAINSGFDGGVVVERLRASTGAQGFDAATGEYVDLLKAGILDPTKVVRIALENAVSVASVLLLAEGTLVEVQKPAKERAGLVEDEPA